MAYKPPLAVLCQLRALPRVRPPDILEKMRASRMGLSTKDVDLLYRWLRKNKLVDGAFLTAKGKKMAGRACQVRGQRRAWGLIP